MERETEPGHEQRNAAERRAAAAEASQERGRSASLPAAEMLAGDQPQGGGEAETEQVTRQVVRSIFQGIRDADPQPAGARPPAQQEERQEQGEHEVPRRASMQEGEIPQRMEQEAERPREPVGEPVRPSGES